MTPETGRISKSGDQLTGPMPITFDARSSQSLDQWGGHFEMPAGDAIDLHVRCRLLMADGRSAAIVPYRKDAGDGRQTIVHFHGVSPLIPD